MALGSDIGEQAALTISTGFNTAVTTLATSLDKLSGVVSTDLADVVTCVVGCVDRLNATVSQVSTAALAELAAWRTLLSKFSVKDHL
jgi:hypothetical protein